MQHILTRGVNFFWLGIFCALTSTVFADPSLNIKTTVKGGGFGGKDCE